MNNSLQPIFPIDQNKTCVSDVVIDVPPRQLYPNLQLQTLGADVSAKAPPSCTEVPQQQTCATPPLTQNENTSSADDTYATCGKLCLETCGPGCVKGFCELLALCFGLCGGE